MKYLQTYTNAEIYQDLNNPLTLKTEEIQSILCEYRQNLIFTNLLNEVYDIIIFFLQILDTYQIKKHENIRQRNIKFLLNFLGRFDDEKFNDYINKNYNIFEESTKYFINRKKNRHFLFRVLIKFLSAQKMFEKLFFKILEKRYKPLGPGYFDAKNSFEKKLKNSLE